MKKTLLLMVCWGLAVTGVWADEEATAARMAFFTKTTEFARVVLHRGPFDAIPSVMEKLEKWFSEDDYTIAGPPIGVYYDHPEQVEPDSLRWEIQIPVTPMQK